MLSILDFRNRTPVAVVFMAAMALSAWGCGSSNDAGKAAVPVSSPAAVVAAPADNSTAAAYENKLVRRPGPTAEDAKVYLVQAGKKRWVVNASWLASHGYHFPADVTEIPAPALDAIPAGDAIQ